MSATTEPAAGAPLVQLYYTSRAAPLDDAALVALLDHARRRNAARGVTGALLHGDGRFLQVLEGPADEVHSLYARIARDPRHDACRLLWDRPVAHRDFAGWTMGFSPLSRARLAALDGYVDFFADDFDLAGFQRAAGAARFLMLAFRTSVLEAPR